MREIEFRGKDERTGEWRYGCFTPYSNYSCYITGDYIDKEDEVWKCLRKTVGQFTGLLDKNGKKIYEGDIVKLFEIDGGYNNCEHDFVGVVTYMPNNDRWYGAEFVVYQDESNFESLAYTNIEVIGNIFDHLSIIK